MEKYKTIDDYIQAQSPAQKQQVMLLRTIITDNYPQLTEHIKWNSPSYVLKDDDRITFNTRPNFPVSIVLHMGATVPEDKKGTPVMDDIHGIIDWKSDTRGVISFTDLADIQAKEAQLIDTLRKWLAVEL